MWTVKSAVQKMLFVLSILEACRTLSPPGPSPLQCPRAAPGLGPRGRALEPGGLTPASWQMPDLARNTVQAPTLAYKPATARAPN
jgi:hypothetical protein